MSTPPAPCACTATRLDRAQAEIRALTARGTLSAAERLALARWQREWLAAWRESSAAA